MINVDELQVKKQSQTQLPEEKLYVHVLKQAIVDYFKWKKQDDYDWFFSEDCKQICIWSGVSQTWLQRFVKMRQEL